MVGHAIHNDFQALKYFHPKERTRDTSRIPLLNQRAGLPPGANASLKSLARHLLQKKIQVSPTVCTSLWGQPGPGSVWGGRDSCMQLVKRCPHLLDVSGVASKPSTLVLKTSQELDLMILMIPSNTGYSMIMFYDSKCRG